jgi:predicted CoA-binding protein
MTSRGVVDDFVSQRKLAVVGVSRKRMKFGNLAFRALRGKGYKLFPVHPFAEGIEGGRCYPSLSMLPEAVDGVLIIVPPAQAEQVVRAAAAAGIRAVCGGTRALNQRRPSVSVRKTASAPCTASAS